MKDKYSGLEDKVLEARQRGVLINDILGKNLEIKKDLNFFLNWDFYDVKNDNFGGRENYINIVPTSSVVRYVLINKKTLIEKDFEAFFLLNKSKKEKLFIKIG